MVYSNIKNYWFEIFGFLHCRSLSAMMLLACLCMLVAFHTQYSKKKWGKAHAWQHDGATGMLQYKMKNCTCIQEGKNELCTCMSVWPKGKKWSVHVCVSVQPKSKKWSVHVYVCLSEEEKMNCTHVRMGIQKINFDWFNSFTPVMYAHVWPKAVTKIQKWSPQFLHHAVKSASTNIGDTAILISPSDQGSKNTSSSTLK